MYRRMSETRSIPGHNLDNMGECSGTLFMDLDADDILTVDFDKMDYSLVFLQ